MKYNFFPNPFLWSEGVTPLSVGRVIVGGPAVQGGWFDWAKL